MAYFNADLDFQFDPKKDNIAIVIKEFTLKKKADKFQRYSEPYIISLAIDESGASNPTIDFNILPFPMVRKGDTVKMVGQGHLIYGPKNPGNFVAFSILFMESDRDVRDLGKSIEKIVKSEAVKGGTKALLKALPTHTTSIQVLLQLTDLISKMMQRDKDDELFRRNGTLLQGTTPPYDILRIYQGENDFIKSELSIIPLKSSNKLGKHTVKIKL